MSDPARLPSADGDPTAPAGVPGKRDGRRVSATDPSSTARKAVEVLEILAASKSGVALNQIAHQLGGSRTSAQRIVAALEEKGLVQRDADGRRYALTPRLLALGNAALNQLEWVDLCKPHMQVLSDAVGETSHLAVLDRWEVIYVSKAEPADSIPLVARVGYRAPAHCTGLGKVLLARYSDQELESFFEGRELIAYTPHTITYREKLLTELAHVRRRGYAVDREEYRPDIRCVAAPICDHRDHTIAAASVTGPAFRMRGRKQKEVALRLVEMVARISLALGAGTRRD